MKYIYVLSPLLFIGALLSWASVIVLFPDLLSVTSIFGAGGIFRMFIGGVLCAAVWFPYVMIARHRKIGVLASMGYGAASPVAATILMVLPIFVPYVFVILVAIYAPLGVGVGVFMYYWTNYPPVRQILCE